MQKYTITEREDGLTLEKYVRKVLNIAPLSFIYKLFRKKDVKVNGHWEDRKYIVHSKDEIAIYVTPAQLEEFNQKNVYTPNDAIKDWVIYEDNQLLLINKPRGVLVQKGESTHSKPLDQMVVEYEMSKGDYNPDEENAFVPGPAHRLDRNTSGIIAFGKTHQALEYLFHLLKERDAIGKHYLTLVYGKIEKDGYVDAPLLKDEATNTVKVASKDNGAKVAKTIYKVVKNLGDYTLLDVTLVTGRTHQIRVHLAYIHHPVIGDSKYGDFKINNTFYKEFGLKNQFLHASEMHFGHLDEPFSYLSSRKFVAPLPSELENIIIQLKEKINHDSQ